MTSLPASLTLRDAKPVLESLRQALAIETGPVWHIDAAPVTQVDTSALAVLLECARLARAAKRPLELVGVPDRLRELAQLYGVDGLLGIAAHPAASIAAPAAVPLA